MRFAFLTPEFVTSFPTGGGLATFLGRITRMLVERGHSVDVFTPALGTSGRAPEQQNVDWHGVNVFHIAVPSFKPGWWEPWPTGYWQRISLGGVGRILHDAKHLAAALNVHANKTPYDVVHGAEYGLTTWYVPHRPGQRIVVRCSSRSAECRRWWGLSYRIDHLLLSHMEKQLLRRADVAYAPAQRTAEDYEQRAGVPVEVVRPPYEVSHTSSSIPPRPLPPRYLLHFGSINRVKGSDWLARSLQLAWKSEPGLQMVWAGTDVERWIPRFQRRWGDQADHVTWLGAVPREEMAGIVASAAAVVAPSRVDNLPNSVLEAQAARVPVIGSHDSSIDEIVVGDVTGQLVDIDDVSGLAAALIAAWRGRPPFRTAKIPLPPIFDELAPDSALARLLNLVTTSPHPEVPTT